MKKGLKGFAIGVIKNTRLSADAKEESSCSYWRLRMRRKKQSRRENKKVKIHHLRLKYLCMHWMGPVTIGP